jgi:hypothetical protein
VKKLGGLLVAVALLAACGSSTSVGGGRSTEGTASISPGVVRQTRFCPTGVTKLATARLPSGFRASAAYDCTEQDVKVAGRGIWLVADESRASNDLSRLVSALQRSDQPMPANISCAAVFVTVVPFVLEGTDRRVVRPRVPRDECGQPQTAAINALDALKWTLVHRRFVRQEESPAEVVSGCPPFFKDLFDDDAASLTLAPGGPPLRDDPQSLTACRYRDTDPAANHPDGQAIPGNEVEVGAFTGWARFKGVGAAWLLRGLSHTRGTTTCGHQHAGFVLLSGRHDTSSYVLIELGGCDRVLEEGVTPSGEVLEGIDQASPSAMSRIDRSTRQMRAPGAKR